MLDKLKAMFVRSNNTNKSEVVPEVKQNVPQVILNNVSKTDNNLKETNMNMTIFLQIGASILSIVKQVEAVNPATDGSAKKDIAMIFIKEVYNDAGLTTTVGNFDTVASQVSAFVDTAVAVYNALGKFVTTVKAAA